MDLYRTIESGDMSKLVSITSSNPDIINVIVHGLNPLQLSCISGNLIFAKFFISKGIDINCETEDTSETPLLLSCRGYEDESYNYCNSRLVRFLLLKKCNKNAVDIMGENALHKSMKQENIAIPELLLRDGIRINSVDFHGRTPLHIACLVLNFEMIKYIVNKGADAEIADSDGNTCLHQCAIGYKQKSKGEIISEIINFLVEIGVNEKIKNKNGEKYSDLLYV